MFVSGFASGVRVTGNGSVRVFACKLVVVLTSLALAAGLLVAGTASSTQAWDGGNTAPTKTISGGSTGLAQPPMLAVTGSGNIYVTNPGNNSVREFSSGATGNVAPTKFLAGGATGLNSPVGVAVASNGDMYVANYDNDSVTMYDADPPSDQTITFGALSDKRLDQSLVTVSATASSGLPVTFTSNTTNVCTVSGASVTLQTTGTCTIKAAQAGNSFWNPATPVNRSFTVTPVSVTPATPKKFKKVGNPKPTASKFKFAWNKSANATTKTVYVLQLWFRGQKKPFMIKSTKKLNQTLTRKQILTAWKKSLRTQVRGETGGIVKFTVKLRAKTGTKVSKPTTTTLRVKV